jgi:hypothetical protein
VAKKSSGFFSQIVLVFESVRRAVKSNAGTDFVNASACSSFRAFRVFRGQKLRVVLVQLELGLGDSRFDFASVCVHRT